MLGPNRYRYQLLTPSFSSAVGRGLKSDWPAHYQILGDKQMLASHGLCQWLLSNLKAHDPVTLLYAVLLLTVSLIAPAPTASR